MSLKLSTGRLVQRTQVELSNDEIDLERGMERWLEFLGAMKIAEWISILLLREAASSFWNFFFFSDEFQKAFWRFLLRKFYSKCFRFLLQKKERISSLLKLFAPYFVRTLILLSGCEWGTYYKNWNTSSIKIWCHTSSKLVFKKFKFKTTFYHDYKLILS